MQPAAATIPSKPDYLVKVSDFFETISPESVARISDLYAPDAYFKDPFNEVQGSDRIKAIFEHMFVQVKNPRFTVVSAVSGVNPVSQASQDTEAYLVWLFDWGKAQPIRGSSHLKFNAAGQITYHRDYWDAAEELYETIPLLGGLMRWLKNRLKVA